MKPNQPDPQKPDNMQQQATEKSQQPQFKIPKKETIDRVVDRLSQLDEIDDPNKTWTPPRRDEKKSQFDLTLTEADEDYSTKPVPPHMLVESGASVSKVSPNVAEANKQNLNVSAQIVGEDKLPLANPLHSPPWTLQQFFDGEIDLDIELARRFPSMPMMSTLKTRTLGTRTGRKVAELASQDGASTLIIDADTVSKVIQLSFTFGSMLTLKFVMNHLSHVDHERWLELMRRNEGGLAFLWGARRWTSDYSICITRKHFTNLYAFSPNNFEAGVRLTPKITQDLLDWLEKIWDEPEPDETPPQLLTW